MTTRQIPLVIEGGEAAEKGLSVFNQTNRQVMDAFEKITELLIAKVEEKNYITTIFDKRKQIDLIP